MIDVEIVKLARRAIAAEVRWLFLALGSLQQPLKIGEMFGPHFLLDAVGAKACDLALHIEPRFINGIAQRIAGIAADNQIAALRHEGRHVADRAAHHDIDALHRNAAA